MRHIRLVVLIAALSSCVGASDCSGSSSGSKVASADATVAAEETPPDSGPAAPMPEPGSAVLFGLGALIAAGATRRLKARRD